jgi:hypothetical protein
VAREVHEREDLLRDATAFAPRLMLRVELTGGAVEVFAGFRDEALSLYFGGDPAFHFNASGELRRAFVGDQLIKAEGGKLAALERSRSPAEISLVRHELDAAQQEQFLGEIGRRLDELRAALDAGRWTLIGQVPPDGDAVRRLRAWLGEGRVVAAAMSPHVGG